MAVRVTERLMDQAKTGIEVDTGLSYFLTLYIWLVTFFRL